MRRSFSPDGLVSGPCQTLALILVAALTCCAPVFADGPKASLPEDLLESSAPEPAKPAPRKIAARKKSSRSATRAHFVDEKGIPLLTNIPSKYKDRKGYRQVSIEYRKVEVAPTYQHKTSAAQYSSNNIQDLVRHYAALYQVDPNLVMAVIRAESGFQPYAVSSAGARGLMQLMPGTAVEMGVTDIFDPAQNIAGGTQYLAKMMQLFKNTDLALAGYNAGPNAVLEYNGIPPYKETQQYVTRVKRYLTEARGGRYVPSYHVASAKPKADSLPTQEGKAYTIHFHSGLTQRADNVLDQDPYYYVQYGNRTSLISKKHVAKVVGPV